VKGSPGGEQAEHEQFDHPFAELRHPRREAVHAACDLLCALRITV
jgi:hypothetical protein